MFLNDMVLLLGSCIVHRSRALEGDDGNALNEFQMICTSLSQNHGVERRTFFAEMEAKFFLRSPAFFRFATAV